MSHKRIISVSNDVMAAIFFSCLSHTVEMFKELQFCTDRVILGKLSGTAVSLGFSGIAVQMVELVQEML
jgi:hypothetical protein